MELTQTRVRELFDYREDGALIAKERQRGRKFGKPIGCPSAAKDGKTYLISMIAGRLYKVHRLVFLYHHGFMPECVDHIDGESLNNRIENLRDAGASGNARNKSHSKNNTSGYKGVTYDKRRSKWVAQIMVDRKHLHVGQFDCPEKAHAAYIEAARKHFGEFARAA